MSGSYLFGWTCKKIADSLVKPCRRDERGDTVTVKLTLSRMIILDGKVINSRETQNGLKSAVARPGAL